jgi:hypothetical protein
MKKNIKARIDDLEKLSNPDRPMISIIQDRDDPELWHPGSRAADPISWDQVEAEFGDYLIIKASYESEVKNEKDN